MCVMRDSAIAANVFCISQYGEGWATSYLHSSTCQFYLFSFSCISIFRLTLLSSLPLGAWHYWWCQVAPFATASEDGPCYIRPLVAYNLSSVYGSRPLRRSRGNHFPVMFSTLLQYYPSPSSRIITLWMIPIVTILWLHMPMLLPRPPPSMEDD